MIHDLLKQLYGTQHLPITVSKPWGNEEIFAATERYVGKIITIKAGHQLSIQYHERKTETNRVLQGKIIIAKGKRVGELVETTYREGDVWHNEPGEIHTIRVAAGEPAGVFVEVSTPELDDVVRLKDEYGREGTNKP